MGDGRLNGLLHRALAELADWQGRTADARREVDTGLELLAHTGDPELAARIAAVGVRAEADGAQAAPGSVAAGYRGRAPGGRLVRRLEGFAAAAVARNAPPDSEATAALLTGRAEATRLAGSGDPERGPAAVAAWEAIAFPYPAAYVRLRLAEAALSAGDDTTAAAALAAAWDTARTLRARPLEGALSRLARRRGSRSPGARATAPAGGRPGPHTPRARGARPRGGGAHQPPDRRGALHQPEDRERPRVAPAGQAGRVDPGEAAAIARREGLLDERRG